MLFINVKRFLVELRPESQFFILNLERNKGKFINRAKYLGYFFHLLFFFTRLLKKMLIQSNHSK